MKTIKAEKHARLRPAPEGTKCELEIRRNQVGNPVRCGRKAYIELGEHRHRICHECFEDVKKGTELAIIPQ